MVECAEDVICYTYFMTTPEHPEPSPEAVEAIKNPNSVGELISLGKDIPTQPDKAYRMVRGRAAIDDLYESGVVRNRQSAGAVEKSRWGERVYWSRGEEGKFHGVGLDTYVIEAPLAVVSEREVTKEDVTAIYNKTEEGHVRDLIDEARTARAEEMVAVEKQREERRVKDEERLRKVREELG